MALLKEIVYDIKNIIRGGVQSDDEIISDRQIEFQIHTLRAQFIRQDINKRRSISDNIKQVISTLDVEIVQGSTCGLTSDAIIVRSKEKVPSSVETAHQNLITAIGPTGILSTNFHMIPYNRAPWAGNNRYTKNMTFAFLLDGFVYVLGPEAEMLKHIKVEGVWQDPTAIANYMNSHGEPCYNIEEDEYPLSTSMLSLIKQSMLEQNIKPMIQMPTDISNNSKSDVQPNAQK
jgi:hypothetical protein|tara:strand:- start:390 stop:1085 length:696 start_codon:yes stop_codon:yes gene_type:complete